MNAIESYLDLCFERHLSTIIERRKLGGVRKEISGMAGMYEAEGTNLIIRLINERGCVNYEIYSKHRGSCHCDGELLAEVLDPRSELERKRSVRRLSLEELTQLFLHKWENIEFMMNEENAAETGGTLHHLGVERSRVMFK